MSRPLRILNSNSEAVTSGEAIEIREARAAGYTCWLVADQPMYIAVGSVADSSSLMLPALCPILLNVSSQEAISALAVDATGNVSASEVRQ